MKVQNNTHMFKFNNVFADFFHQFLVFCFFILG